jgi:hypothetical protein
MNSRHGLALPDVDHLVLVAARQILVVRTHSCNQILYPNPHPGRKTIFCFDKIFTIKDKSHKSVNCTLFRLF